MKTSYLIITCFTNKYVCARLVPKELNIWQKRPRVAKGRKRVADKT